MARASTCPGATRHHLGVRRSVVSGDCTVRRPRCGGSPRFRAHRRQPERRRCDLPCPRRASAGDRAGRSTVGHAVAWRHPAAARAPLRPPGRRCPRPRTASADAPLGRRLERGPPRRSTSPVLRPPRSVSCDVRSRCRRSGRRRTRGRRSVADAHRSRPPIDGHRARTRPVPAARHPARAYASELLADADADATSHRHAQHYLGLAERGEVGIRGPDQLHWLELLRAAVPQPPSGTRVALEYR